MPKARIGGFQNEGDAERLYVLYDAFVAEVWPVPAEELDVDTSFGSTHVRRSGPADGVPIVFIHPSSATSIGWYRLIGPVAERHPVIAFDTMGTPGRSVQTAPLTSGDDMARWLDEALDALELDRVHLVGYSEGGWIAGTHAARTARPHRLVTLTLIEPGGALIRVRPPTLLQLVLRGMWIIKGPGDSVQQLRALNAWLSPGVELTDREIEFVLTVFETYRTHLPLPSALDDAALASISAPTLVLLAEQTVLYDANVAADRARQSLHDVEVEVVPGAGHGLPFQFPELTCDRLLRHIEAHPVGTTPSP